jgi:hypothetical protein
MINCARRNRQVRTCLLANKTGCDKSKVHLFLRNYALYSKNIITTTTIFINKLHCNNIVYPISQSIILYIFIASI